MTGLNLQTIQTQTILLIYLLATNKRIAYDLLRYSTCYCPQVVHRRHPSTLRD